MTQWECRCGQRFVRPAVPAAYRKQRDRHLKSKRHKTALAAVGLQHDMKEEQGAGR